MMMMMMMMMDKASTPAGVRTGHTRPRMPSGPGWALSPGSPWSARPRVRRRVARRRGRGARRAGASDDGAGCGERHGRHHAACRKVAGAGRRRATTRAAARSSARLSRRARGARQGRAACSRIASNGAPVGRRRSHRSRGDAACTLPESGDQLLPIERGGECSILMLSRKAWVHNVDGRRRGDGRPSLRHARLFADLGSIHAGACPIGAAEGPKQLSPRAIFADALVLPERRPISTSSWPRVPWSSVIASNAMPSK
jgi:hypothetical protein